MLRLSDMPTLIPTTIGYKTITSSLQSYNALYLEFSESMSSYSSTERLTPSYDGTSEGVMGGVEYSVLGYNNVSPIGESTNNMLTPSDGSAPYVISKKMEWQSYLYMGPNDRVDLTSQPYRGYDFYYAPGVCIAKFADDNYTFGWVYVYHRPDTTYSNRSFVATTDSAFGYMVISPDATGHVSLHFEGLRFGSSYKTAAEILIANAVEENADPFEPGGTTGDDDSESEGGDGNFENEEVTVDPPALPSLSAITSGFIAAYMPSFSQLQALGDYLWSDLFSLDTFKKLFSDPMQAILGLSLVPVTPSTNDGYVVIGNVNTSIIMPRVMQQFVTVDCGSVTLPEYWGGYLDYSPYTKVEIYLPYIGVRPLDTDEVMGKTLHVVYHVDVLSGACVCFIQCDNTIRYHYVGQCGASIPITANDWTRVVNGAVSIATALGVGVATLGAGAAAAGGITAASMAGAGALVGGVASQVLASKPRVEHSGSLAGMGGILGVQFPYILIQRPRQAVPSGQNAFTGYPSFIKRTLSTVTGYTQVTGVHLTGLSCTDEEKKEIQSYLEAGVIL